MGSPYSWLGPAMSDLDDLMAAFAGVNVDDHDELVETFARVLGTDGGSARFFLEASQWNLEVALGNFLDTVGSRVSRTRLAPPLFVSVARRWWLNPRVCWSRATWRGQAACLGRCSKGTRLCSRSGRRRFLRGSQLICTGSF